jgi:hypothetical protein
MSGSSSDQIIMLLSSDWFYKVADVFDIRPSPDSIKSVQSLGRAIVRDLMGSETNYFYVDFSEERRRGSLESFLAGVEHTSLDERSKAAITSLLSVDDETSRASFLVRQILADLAAEAPGISALPLSPLAVVAARDACAEVLSENGRERLSAAATAASTNWDRFLAALTPDQPTALEDLAQARRRCHEVQKVWEELQSRLSLDERRTFRQWCISEVWRLVEFDPSFDARAVPDWEG